MMFRLIALLTSAAIFVTPIQMPNNWASLLWVLPLCAAVSLVYKTIKCEHPAMIVRQSVVILVTILVFMAIAATSLYAVARYWP